MDKNKWISSKDSKPVANIKCDGYMKSKNVVAVIREQMIIVNLQTGNYNGKDWEQWYCPAYQEVVIGIDKWCDCIPDM